jgi:hypothetical protein
MVDWVGRPDKLIKNSILGGEKASQTAVRARKLLRNR